jgi:hypothetical protein
MGAFSKLTRGQQQETQELTRKSTVRAEGSCRQSYKRDTKVSSVFNAFSRMWKLPKLRSFKCYKACQSSQDVRTQGPGRYSAA